MMRNHPDAMSAFNPILISLSSFGAAEVRRHGQLWFTRLAHAAGADGVEVRGELLTKPRAELADIADAARELSLELVYSSPQGLWNADGELDGNALDDALRSSALLGAPRMKMSIGGYRGQSWPTLATLKRRLQEENMDLVIENDQTAAAGTLSAIRDFLDAAGNADLHLGMTFDMGNWHWTGECPLQAAQHCAPQVSYVHCKGVQRQPQRWVAVPLAESAAPWRAVLRELPADVPWAIEYPLQGDDLEAVTRREVAALRALAAGFRACERESLP
jgi:sugar phosphate isomerase/epimerase